MTPKAQSTKTKQDAWNYIKIRTFCTAKEAINREKTDFFFLIRLLFSFMLNVRNICFFSFFIEYIYTINGIYLSSHIIFLKYLFTFSSCKKGILRGYRVTYPCVLIWDPQKQSLRLGFLCI